MKNRRIPSGASMPLMIVCFIILVIIGIAAFVFVTMFGTSRQFSSAADAGALNVGKTALTKPSIKLSLVSDNAANYFKGVGDGPGGDEINLGNINGVWGAALLVGLNYEAMANPGSGTASIKSGKAQEEAKQNAIKMAQSAGDVAKALRQKLETSLQDTGELRTAFKDFCTANYPQAKAETKGTWVVRYTDAGSDSNFMISDKQLPEGLSESLKTKVGAGSKLKGYTDLKIDDNIPELTYCFVPLSGKTHLVSDDRAKDKVANVAKAEFYVPNTFHTQSQVFMEKDSKTIGAVTVNSYAESGDLVTHTPHISGFLRISNHKGMNSEESQIMVNSLSADPNRAIRRVTVNQTRPTGGLHAIEYLNFQMLYGRSNGDGPTGGKDPVATLMDFPIWIVRDPANPKGNPLRTANNAAYVYGTQLDVRDTYENLIKDKENGAPMPDAQPTDAFGGGNQWECLNGPLPNSYVSKDEKDITKLAKYLNPNNAELIDERMVGLRPNTNVIADQWYSDLVYNLGPHDDGRTVYGSTAHPHVWSRAPKVDSGSSVRLCQSAPQLGYDTGWNDPTANSAPKVGYWLTSAESGSGPGANPFSGMMVIGPGRTTVEVDNPAQFREARVGTVKQLIFADESPNFWTQGQMSTDAGNMGANLGTQYADELRFLHDGIIARLITRINQIAQLPPKDPNNPADASKRTSISEADLKAMLSGMNDPQLAMGQSAYIYVDKLLGKPEFGYLVCRASGLPAQFNAKNVAVDGRAVGENLDRDSVRSDNPFDVATNSVAYLGPRYPNSEKLYNVAGDWQFNQPFVNQQVANAQTPAQGAATDVRWWAMYVLTPCTGASGGILCDLSLREFFNQPDKAAGWNGQESQAGMAGPCATTLTTQSGNFHGSRPIDCPCECFPDYRNAYLPDTAKTRLASENTGKNKVRRHVGISGQPHSAAPPPPPATTGGGKQAARCKANCSHGGPC